MFSDFVSLKGPLGLILIIDHLKKSIFFLKKFVNKNVKNIFVLVEKKEDSRGLFTSTAPYILES